MEQKLVKSVYADDTLVGLGEFSVTDTIPLVNIPDTVCKLGLDGFVKTENLPSYIDDVLEYSTLAAFPAVGSTGKIYVDMFTNKTYRWGGSSYVYITSGAVDTVAGKTGVVVLAKADVGLSLVDNTSDVSKPVSALQLTALNAKMPLAGTTGAVSFGAVTASGALIYGSNSGPSPLALGTPTKFQLLNGGAYGLLGDVLTTGSAYLQVGRNDANTASYNLLLQPLGSNVLIGTATDNGSGAKLQVNGAITSTGLAVTGGISASGEIVGNSIYSKLSVTPAGVFSANTLLTQYEEANIARIYICGANSTTRGALYVYTAVSDGSPISALTVSSTGIVVGGNITSNGGLLYTFGANDSAGAGYRTVRVSNS